MLRDQEWDTTSYMHLDLDHWMLTLIKTLKRPQTQGLELLTGLSFASGGNTLGRAASRMIQSTTTTGPVRL